MEEIDRISYMAEVIIYNVMDFLPTKEVVRTSIVSKRWQHMQASYPNLDFDQKYFGRELAIRKPKIRNLVDRYPDLEEKRDNFIRFVDETLLRFHEQGLRIRKFKLDFTIFESTMVSLVDGWIGSATESRVEELHVRIISPHGTMYKLPQTVFATSSLKALKLEEIDLEQLLHQSIRFHSLQKFSLLNVHVDARVIASIISSCPLIEEIKLTACLGLHKVHIFGLHNLKEVDILQCHGIIESHIEAPSLQKLHYGDENREICPSKFNLIACQNLKWLSLHRVLISDQQFTDLISKFPLLEVLSVFNCMLLERVKISNQSLKRLTLVTLVPNGLEEVEIDAPNLQSVGYSGEVIPVITSTSASAKWDVDIELYPDYRMNSQSFCRMNSQSFCLMRNLFAKGWNFKFFKLSIECLEISFNVEETRDILLPLVPVVDHIKLDLQSSPEGYSALLDGLLWSCHPKILSVEFMDLESQSKFIMVLREKIVHKFDLNSEHLESIRGWQHDLKDVEFHDGDGRPLNWSAPSDVTPNSRRGPKLNATFKW